MLTQKVRINIFHIPIIDLTPVCAFAVVRMRRQNMAEQCLVQLPIAAAKAVFVDDYATAVAGGAERIRICRLYAGHICCGETNIIEIQYLYIVIIFILFF